ncbi:MAG: hypothetical protein ACI9KS_002380, partial [Sulfitobacter sp.]
RVLEDAIALATKGLGAGHCNAPYAVSSHLRERMTCVFAHML